MTLRFTEAADRVYVLREPMLEVNVTLVVGDGAALLVDTLSTAGQAAELAAAVRTVTTGPLTVVNTHHHFDHCFGNRTLAADPPRPVYAHTSVVAALRDRPDRVRRAAVEEMRASQPALAVELARTALLAPTEPVEVQTVLDVGGRRVLLRHPGPGHTAGDLVVQLPDVDVLVAGDLVESAGPPDFADAYPLRWPDAVADLLRLTGPGTVVVPGHGPLVDVGFVRTQHARLTELAGLIRAAHAAGDPPERVAEVAPFGTRAGLDAARRGFAQLDGVD
ncbi:MBL fold metallo-hydrolase [Micromonospora sp. WMMA1923]|uniref:MBL fold metallo-hydrolase n=1 Tax=Micromonospora sp. WMMA1923 TaxID=3404125 RepID=UPI003B95F4F1